MWFMLVVLFVEAGGGEVIDGLLVVVVVELVYNFLLLHDDIMDCDVE